MPLPLRGNSSLSRSYDFLTQVRRNNVAAHDRYSEEQLFAAETGEQSLLDYSALETQREQKKRNCCVSHVAVASLTVVLLIQLLQTGALIYVYKTQASPLLPHAKETLNNVHNITEEVLSPSTQLVVDQIKHTIVPDIVQNLYILYSLPQFINETESAIEELRKLLRRFEPSLHQKDSRFLCVSNK